MQGVVAFGFKDAGASDSGLGVQFPTERLIDYSGAAYG